MIRFLLDANLSPLSAEHLRSKGYDAISLYDLGKHQLTDPEVVALAKKQKRIILTFDLDFGEIYYHQKAGRCGIIVLRISDQTVESVNVALDKFLGFYSVRIRSRPNSLVIVSPNKVRFITSSM